MSNEEKPMHPEIRKMWEEYFDKCFAAFAEDHKKFFGMSKQEALQTIKLLSALESWAFSQSTRLPDYLVEDIQRSLETLERVVLEEKK